MCLKKLSRLSTADLRHKKTTQPNFSTQQKNQTFHNISESFRLLTNIIQTNNKKK